VGNSARDARTEVATQRAITQATAAPVVLAKPLHKGIAAERTMGLFLYRLMGAAMLDGSMYEGIEADRSITRQAAVAVLLSSMAAGFGAGGWSTGDLRMFAAVSAIALVTWIAWAVLMHQIGTRLLPEPQTRATLGELLRTMGFAAAPGLLQIFAAFPLVTIPVFVVSVAWMFAAMVTGVRHALDYTSSWRALGVCAIAFLLAIVVAIALGVVFAPTVS
jgi:hypothetical protein